MPNDHRIQLLPNGLVRVDAPSGLVTLWHLTSDGQVRRHSGQGSIPVQVMAAIELAWL